MGWHCKVNPHGDWPVRFRDMPQTVRDPLYRRQPFPAGVIAHAVWLCLRFPLSLRMVEDLRAARVLTVSHQTVRLGPRNSGGASPMKSGGDQPGRLATNGILMKSSSPLAARNSGCAGPSIRIASFLRCSGLHAVVGMKRTPHEGWRSKWLEGRLPVHRPAVGSVPV